MARMRRSIEMASMQDRFDSKQFHSTARQQGAEAVVSVGEGPTYRSR